MTMPDAYILCTSPRSGSTLLCHLLRAVPGAGHPGSHFHEPSLDGWLDDYNLDRADYATRQDALAAVFAAARRLGSGGGDLFALRLQRHSFAFFIQQLGHLYGPAPDDRSLIETAFGRTAFVHLTRQDKLAQAISFVKAEKTGLWHRAPDGREIERLAPPRAPAYDARAIAHTRDLFEDMDRDWKAWFAREGIAPLRLTYEALALDPHAELARVLGRIGLPGRPEGEPPLPVAKLADATSRDWANRFLSEESGG